MMHQAFEERLFVKLSIIVVLHCIKYISKTYYWEI